MTVEPLVIEFDVDVAPAHAFDAWTRQCASWWPTSHTVSGQPDAISFEPRPGGRIVEHGPTGAEHDWGRVVDWQPPRRLRYRWHLFFEPEDATEVEVTFTPRGAGTSIRLEQRGFEFLGDRGAARRNKTQQAWALITAAFERFLDGVSERATGR